LKNSCITLVLMCGFLFGLAGCGDKGDKPQSNIATAPQPVVLQQPSNISAQSSPSITSNSEAPLDVEAGMPAAAKKNNCTACHSINKKIVGPAWMNVSVKYKGASKFEYNGKEYPLVEGLMMKVSQGGSGHWGSMPMPPNDYKGIKQAEIKELVLFVLGLAK
jgi:cytochrome c